MPDLICYLIDDDEDDREIFALALHRTNAPYRYLSSGSGTDAMRRFESDETFIPDFIFLDLNMPGMHGAECLSEIKKIPRLAQIPVIIYSTSSNPVFEEETLRLNASHYLVKPTDINRLSAILMDIFNGKELPFFVEE